MCKIYVEQTCPKTSKKEGTQNFPTGQAGCGLMDFRVSGACYGKINWGRVEDLVSRWSARVPPLDP